MSHGDAIREFAPEDVAAVRALVHHTIDTCYAGMYAEEAIEHMKDHHSEERILEDARDGCTLVVERDGAIVATGTLTGAKIRRLFVHPAYQRAGLGKRLMRELEARAAAAGAAAIELYATVGSRTFYERLGYALVEEKCSRVRNDQELRWYVMSRGLRASD